MQHSLPGQVFYLLGVMGEVPENKETLQPLTGEEELSSGVVSSRNTEVTSEGTQAQDIIMQISDIQLRTITTIIIFYIMSHQDGRLYSAKKAIERSASIFYQRQEATIKNVN